MILSTEEISKRSKEFGFNNKNAQNMLKPFSSPLDADSLVFLLPKKSLFDGERLEAPLQSSAQLRRKFLHGQQPADRAGRGSLGAEDHAKSR